MTTTMSEGPPKDEEDDALHIAMLSVYYRSLGSELESRGAPVMLVPPQVQPMPLDEALDRLQGRPDLLWDAYWRVVRSVPVEGWQNRSIERRYPRIASRVFLNLTRILSDRLERMTNLLVEQRVP